MYERFEELLRKNGVSVADIVRATGINHSTLSNWKKRNNLISGKNAKLIADYFNVSVDYLMGVSDIAVNTNSPVLKSAEKRWKLYHDELAKMYAEHEYLKTVSPTHSECDLILAFRNADYRTQRSVLMALGLDKQEEELRAAHERTDIETTNAMKQHDYDIMKGDDF